MQDRLQLRIPCGFRKALQLLSKSCHLHLSSLGFQTGPQQVDSLHQAIKALGEAYESKDLDSLYRCTVGLLRADGSMDSTVLSSANSQLHALNTDADGFKYGYEPDISAMIDFFVGDEGCLVDVGANFGYFPIYLASRRGFKGTVYAFEPSERGFADLRHLVTRFNLSEPIKIYQCALGDTAGHADLFLSNSDGLTTMMASMANRLEQVVNKHRVQVARLDDFPIKSIDVIKIDVEGAETLVIAGGLNAIKAHTPLVIFESWASVDDSGAFHRLQECGYQFFVPTWQNQKRQMSISIGDAIDPSTLALVKFRPEERKTLPDRFNVTAIHTDRLNKLRDHQLATSTHSVPVIASALQL